MTGHWEQFFILLIAALMLWLMWRNIRANPQAFSKENLGKSFYTIGLLALFLIAFIAVLVGLLGRS